jgi:hypothetical protein
MDSQKQDYQHVAVVPKCLKYLKVIRDNTCCSVRECYLIEDVLYQWMFSVRVQGCSVLEDVAF